jgi:hypothetical protein
MKLQTRNLKIEQKRQKAIFLDLIVKALHYFFVICYYFHLL